MGDFLQRYIHEDGQFQAAVIETTEVGRRVFSRLKPSPIGLQLMTQAMTGALLLVSRLKGDGVLSLKFEGTGPAGSIVVEANTAGHVRGFLGDPNVHFEAKPDVGLFEQAMGTGTLKVRRTTEATHRAFESMVPLVRGELSVNFGNFLLTSEQIPAGIQLGAILDPVRGVSSAGGVMIQALPDADPNILVILEDRLRTMPAIGKFLAEADGHERIRASLFEGLPTKALERMPVQFHCGCNRQKVLRVVAALPEADLREMVKEGGPVTVLCHFCTEPYTCTAGDLAAILELKHQSAGRGNQNRSAPN